MFTVGSSTSATFVLPAHHGTCVALQTKRMETDRLRAVMTKLKHAQADDVAIPAQKAFLYSSGGTKFMLYKTSISVTHGSHVHVRSVASVGRSGITITLF